MKTPEILIAPSILSADFANLGHDVEKISEAGADWIHIDVMDGQFVPPITIGDNIVKSLRRHSEKVFDVHLMVVNPQNQIACFAAAGADVITFHIEAAPHAHRVIQNIHALGKKAGVALNPATPLAAIEEIVCDVDLVLIMTVNPGYGGQKFIATMAEKIARLKNLLAAKNCAPFIEVDGGINQETAPIAIKNGANVLVAGSYVFGAADYKNAMDAIRVS